MHKKIAAIIVDDEKGCITNLQHYLTKLCPEINIIATGSTLKEALTNAGNEKIDLAFLDVEIYDDNIFNALGELPGFDFKIVFVTAYQQYALKAIKVEAIDYILKPLLEDDILECYAKIKKHFMPTNDAGKQGQEALSEKKNKKIIIKNSDNIYIIKSDDVYYMEANGFYTTITFIFNDTEKSVLLSKPMQKAEDEYQYPMFFRVHKSYIVNTAKISGLIKDDGMNIKMINNKIIPVAKRRINDFMDFLNRAD